MGTEEETLAVFCAAKVDGAGRQHSGTNEAGKCLSEMVVVGVAGAGGASGALSVTQHLPLQSQQAHLVWVGAEAASAFETLCAIASSALAIKAKTAFTP